MMRLRIVVYMAYHWLHCYPAMTVLPLTNATRLEPRSAHSPPSLIPRLPGSSFGSLAVCKNIVQAIQNWNWGRAGNEPKLYHPNLIPRQPSAFILQVIESWVGGLGRRLVPSHSPWFWQLGNLVAHELEVEGRDSYTLEDMTSVVTSPTALTPLPPLPPPLRLGLV